MKEKVVCIVGPTASGKTSLSVALAQAVGGEVISADSRQVYRGLDVGSGKVTAEEMAGVPHHLLDVADPKEVFNASDFVRLGREAIDGIVSRGALPIIVGGTGFYIDALLGRTSLAGAEPNEILRAKLEAKSLEELQTLLKQIDPERFETVDQKNPRRLVRAIEIADTLGKNPPPQKEELYDVLWLGVTHPWDTLKERIHTRLLDRLENEDMLGEVGRLYKDGVSYERMESLGLEYRYMARHLSGALSYENMVTQLEREIVRYAKRQMTWLKRNKDIVWLSPKEVEKAITLTKQFLK